MNELLRRIKSLSAVAVTTEVAPTLGPPIDVTSGAPTPVTDRRTVPLVEPPLPAMPSPRNTGTCYHDGHIDYDDDRLGVLVIDAYHASLLPCPYLNADGR